MRDRWAASLIDLLVVLAGLAIMAGTYAGIGIRRAERVRQAGRSLSKVAGSAREMLINRLVLFAIAALLTGRQSPGARIVGIRLVDSSMGAPLSRRQAILRVGIREAWRVLAHRLLPSPGVSQPPNCRRILRPFDANIKIKECSSGKSDASWRACGTRVVPPDSHAGPTQRGNRRSRPLVTASPGPARHRAGTAVLVER